jgi:hypothetical protein
MPTNLQFDQQLLHPIQLLNVFTAPQQLLVDPPAFL